jgi:hypothetical protein
MVTTLHGLYLELWVRLASSHGDACFYPEPGGLVRVSQLDALVLHTAEIQVHAQGYLQAFSHLNI